MKNFKISALIREFPHFYLEKKTRNMYTEAIFEYQNSQISVHKLEFRCGWAHISNEVTSDRFLSEYKKWFICGHYERLIFKERDFAKIFLFVLSPPIAVELMWVSFKSRTMNYLKFREPYHLWMSKSWVKRDFEGSLPRKRAPAAGVTAKI